MSTEQQRAQWREYYHRTRATRLAKAQTPEAKAVHRAWLDANKEKTREYKRQDYRKHKAKRLTQTNEWRRKHPRTREYYTDYLKRSKERVAGRPRPEQCEICDSTDRIHFDHCHASGAFRGWICRDCNLVLGFVKDDPTRLRKLIAYLEQANT